MRHTHEELRKLYYDLSEDVIDGIEKICRDTNYEFEDLDIEGDDFVKIVMLRLTEAYPHIKPRVLKIAHSMWV